MNTMLVINTIVNIQYTIKFNYKFIQPRLNFFVENIRMYFFEFEALNFLSFAATCRLRYIVSCYRQSILHSVYVVQFFKNKIKR